MAGIGEFFEELKRRNVLRAGVLYAAAAWALAQGAAQLLPVYDVSAWVMRWIIAALIIGFPFWVAFAWFYEFTPTGLKRESEIAPGESIGHSTDRKLDFWIIGILAAAVVLLLTDRLMINKGNHANPAGTSPSGADLARSIAVLPLHNEGGNPQQQYFSDGLSEDLITALAQFSGLRVINRNSSFQFRNSKDSVKTIGAKLGVTHLVEGSVRHQGDEVRISGELVNVGDGSTLWSQSYDRPYKDLFKLQDEITKSIAEALHAKLLPSPGAVVQSDRPPGGSLDAYAAYLHGNASYMLGTEKGKREAVDDYNQAIELDPKYAAAYAGMAVSWTDIGNQFVGGDDARAADNKARVAANTAVALDPDLAEAHYARAWLLSTVDLDWAGAEAEAKRAMQLAPHNGRSAFTLGTIMATLGNPQRAVELTRQALTTDPRHANWYIWLSTYLAALGRYDEARQAMQTAIDLQPAAPGMYNQMTIVEVLRGDAKAALAAAQHEERGVWRDVAQALALQVGNDSAAADAALNSLIKQHGAVAAYQIAQVYALRNDPVNMFAWLERARSNRDPGLSYLLYDPLILRFKNDPRFAILCNKVGLPAPNAIAARSSTSAMPSPPTSAAAAMP